MRLADEHVLYLFLSAVALALGWRALDFDSLTRLSGAVLEDRSGIGAGELLAFFAMFSVAASVRREQPLSKSDLVVIAAASLGLVYPSRVAASGPVLLAGAKLALTRSASLRSLGHLLLALAAYEWIGPGIFHLLSPIILKLEAIGVQTLLMPFGSFSRSGVVISGPAGHAIYVEEGCSAFHNLSFATLLWISLLKLESVSTRRWDWLTLAGMVAATILLNLIRIALMANSPLMFVYWHNGVGATIASVTILGVAIGIFLLMRNMMVRP